MGSHSFTLRRVLRPARFCPNEHSQSAIFEPPFSSTQDFLRLVQMTAAFPLAMAESVVVIMSKRARNDLKICGLCARHRAGRSGPQPDLSFCPNGHPKPHCKADSPRPLPTKAGTNNKRWCRPPVFAFGHNGEALEPGYPPSA